MRSSRASVLLGVSVCAGWQPPATRIAVERSAALPCHPAPSLPGAQEALRLCFLAEASAMNAGSTSLSSLRVDLKAAGFRPLSERDVDLSAALNLGYLLRLSIAPSYSGLEGGLGDEEAIIDPESGRVLADAIEDLYAQGVLVYCRGHGIERSRGRFLVEKLAYLQGNLLERLTPLARRVDATIPEAERWLTYRVRKASTASRLSFKRLRHAARSRTPSTPPAARALSSPTRSQLTYTLRPMSLLPACVSAPLGATASPAPCLPCHGGAPRRHARLTRGACASAGASSIRRAACASGCA